MKQHHQFHLVPLSPWPIFTAFSLLFITLGATLLLHKYSFGEYLTILGVLSLLYCLYSWWRDIVNEGLVERHHTSPVRIGLRMGMALFIISEIMFFFVFFCSFFKFSIFPVGILDGVWVIKSGVWPQVGIMTLDPWDIPFINTLILLLSGTTVTWAHYSILGNNQKDSVTAIGLTVLLGVTFSCFQAYEYYHASFTLNSGIYASNFYMATGFHGLHVIIGTLFLSVCYFRARRGDFQRPNGHLGFEFAAWYWHFVDVVWLFLFTFVYVLGR